MRIEDLRVEDLLNLGPDGGVILFAGQREILVDAVAMGILRKYLVENFGLTAARTVLTQFGFAHGWRLSESLSKEIQWDTDKDRLGAGTRLHVLQGLFRLEPGSSDPTSESGVYFTSSYEAEQHLLHFGRSDEPVCWTICGLTSGFISHAQGEEVFVLEDRCEGAGAAVCHLIGRTREEWGQERADDLLYFEPKRLDECLEVSLRRVTESLKHVEQKLIRQARALAQAAPDYEQSKGFIAKSQKMLHVIDLAKRIAKVDSTVLITGESGVGKERVARLIHEESVRSSGPFIAINCGGVTETLLESELFGHARGAFTGATTDRPGLFEAANRGTLLLDEVGEISPSMQVQLLRVLQEREIRRVGENKTRAIDVRVLASTNRDLAKGVASGAFRTDLYYRLNVIQLNVPGLRERRDDILPLTRALLASTAVWMKRETMGIAPEAAEKLLQYEWPGNVRELENVIERVVALSPGSRVELNDLPEEIRHTTPHPVATTGNVRPLDEVEMDYILAALDINDGNQTRTAKQLQIGTATLYRKLKKHGVDGNSSD